MCACSNAGFSLLGGILSQVAGTTYEDYLAKYVFSPLGMNSSAFAVRTAGPRNACVPHQLTPTVGRVQAPSNLDNIALGYASPSSPPAPLTSLQYVNPAGGLRTTGHDMAEFMKLLHRQNEAAHSTPAQILDGKSIREWLTEPVYHNPAVVPAGALLDDGACWSHAHGRRRLTVCVCLVCVFGACVCQHGTCHGKWRSSTMSAPRRLAAIG